MTRRPYLLPALLAAAISTPALAITPESWVHTTESDFQPGEAKDTVVTNLGDIKLAAGTTTVAEAPEGVTIFSDAVAIGGETFVAAGPDGRLLRKAPEGETFEEVAKLEGQQVFALADLDGTLLVGVSAEGKSRLAVLREGKLVDIVALPEVRYVWDLLVVGDAVFVATGIEGRVFRFTGLANAEALPPAAPAAEPAPAEPAAGNEQPAAEAAEVADAAEAADAADAPKPILDAQQANTLCLAADGESRIYVGTDTDGLVYRLTPNEAAETGYDAFVIYDAPEPEIGALLVNEEGLVYAGTADAEQAKPGRLAEASDAQAGRPDAEGAAAPAPAAPVPPAEGAEAPAPTPGDLPQVPPKAPPIGGEDGEATPAPGDGDDQAAQTDQPPAGPAAPPAPAEPVAEAAPAAPTPEQYDRLRAAIRARLDAARKAGNLQAGPIAAGPRPSGAGGVSGGSRSRPPATPTPPKEGNAVYRIDAQGFVSEVFRESVMILRLHQDGPGGRLLIATGNEGQLFAVDAAAEETTTVADLDAEQITALLPSEDGVELVTANPASLRRLGEGIAAEGTYTSPIMDAEQVSLWGNMQLTATIPDGTRVLVSSRSGNVADPEQAPWSPWTDDTILEPNADLPSLTPREVPVQAPPARFVQYRLTLRGTDETEGGAPTVDRVETNYVTPNLRPRIATLTATYPETPPAAANAPANQPAPPTPTNMTVTWEASDPNADAMLYKLEFQPAGSTRWITIAEDVAETTYEWQTARVPDGRYTLRVTASDGPSNPGDMAMTATRRSDPVLVDNTPPQLTDIETRLEDGTATISGRAGDALSQVHSIAYIVDSEEQYRPILPRDLIFDSTSERWSVTLSDLSPGPHVVTLRVRDRRGNTTHVPVLLNADGN